MSCDEIGEISTGAKSGNEVFQISGFNYFFRVVVLEGLLDGGRNRRRTSWKVGEARDVGSLTCERGGLKKKTFRGFEGSVEFVCSEAESWLRGGTGTKTKIKKVCC